MSKGHDPKFDGSYSSSRYADKSLEEDLLRVINHGVVVGEDSDGGVKRVDLNTGRVDKWTPGTPDKYYHTYTNKETGKEETIERGNGTKDENKDNKDSDGGCYLTTACLTHFGNEFDDNGYDLTVLRQFRDNHVSTEDVRRYYEIAPLIVARIESMPAKDRQDIFESIYRNVVRACVGFIERGQYNEAYWRYKNSTITLQRYLLPSAI